MGDGKVRSDMTVLEGIAEFVGIKETPLHEATSSWPLINPYPANVENMVSY